MARTWTLGTGLLRLSRRPRGWGRRLGGQAPGVDRAVWVSPKDGGHYATLRRHRELSQSAGAAILRTSLRKGPCLSKDALSEVHASRRAAALLTSRGPGGFCYAFQVLAVEADGLAPCHILIGPLRWV
jgi:hypothetical protein